MDRIVYSIQAAVLFLIIASPFMYNIVHTILGSIVPIATNGCPTMAGVVIHAVVFGLLTYLLMVVQTPAVPSIPSVEAFKVSKKDY
jgi:hypothetical protein